MARSYPSRRTWSWGATYSSARWDRRLKVASSFRIASLLFEVIVIVVVVVVVAPSSLLSFAISSPSSITWRRAAIVTDDTLMASKFSLNDTPSTYLFASGNTLVVMWFCKNPSGHFLTIASTPFLVASSQNFSTWSCMTECPRLHVKSGWMSFGFTPVNSLTISSNKSSLAASLSRNPCDPKLKNCSIA